MVKFGGQTPLNLTAPPHGEGAPILGTSPAAVDLAEDRQRCNGMLDRPQLRYPKLVFRRRVKEAHKAAQSFKYPVLVQLLYVGAGRATAIAYGPEEIVRSGADAFATSFEGRGQVLVDTFLKAASELDVDALCDGRTCVIAGVMEHIEEADVHSIDWCSVLPPYKVSEAHFAAVCAAAGKIALELGGGGLMNVQFATAQGRLCVLEVNPRASRTVPFVAKTTGVPLAKVATRLMLGKTLAQEGLSQDLEVDCFFGKTPVSRLTKFMGFTLSSLPRCVRPVV